MTRRTTGQGISASKLLVSAAIAGVLFCQTITAFHWVHTMFHGRGRKGYYWPFLDYPMYSRPHARREPFDRYVLFARLEDGTEVEIVPADLSLTFWKFEKGPVRAILRDDPAQLVVYVRSYEARFGRRLTAVRLENHPRVLGEAGLTDAPVQVVKTVDLVAGAAEVAGP